ncbi:MAG: hypothetical protein KGM17_02475 [Sphingomonadales bacterium]|nr:hypothetical protein [Sphingomonadales bacterium]
MPNGPGTGPYPAIMETDPGLPDHVVYRPSRIAALGQRKLGVLVWGNGGCREDGASARLHLLEIASHGYVAIAPGRVLSGPTATERRVERQPGADGRLPPVATTAEDVRAGLTWALRENRRKGSRYFGRVDPALTAVAGHSCGGLQALQVAGDKRIHAVLIHNSGVFADGSNPIQGLTVDKSLLKTLHTPVVYFLGGPTDVAFPNGSDDFRRIDHVPAVLVNLPVGHGGTFFRANGGAVAAAAVDWLDWQLRGDKVAGRTFTGANCRLCGGAGTGWTIERKRID